MFDNSDVYREVRTRMRNVSVISKEYRGSRLEVCNAGTDDGVIALCKLTAIDKVQRLVSRPHGVSILGSNYSSHAVVT
jgi:hypothetical protein